MVFTTAISLSSSLSENVSPRSIVTSLVVTVGGFLALKITVWVSRAVWFAGSKVQKYVKNQIIKDVKIYVAITLATLASRYAGDGGVRAALGNATVPQEVLAAIAQGGADDAQANHHGVAAAGAAGVGLVAHGAGTRSRRHWLLPENRWGAFCEIEHLTDKYECDYQGKHEHIDFPHMTFCGRHVVLIDDLGLS